MKNLKLFIFSMLLLINLSFNCMSMEEEFVTSGKKSPGKMEEEKYSTPIKQDVKKANKKNNIIYIESDESDKENITPQKKNKRKFVPLSKEKQNDLINFEKNNKATFKIKITPDETREVDLTIQKPNFLGGRVINDDCKNKCIIEATDYVKKQTPENLRDLISKQRLINTDKKTPPKDLIEHAISENAKKFTLSEGNYYLSRNKKNNKLMLIVISEVIQIEYSNIKHPQDLRTSCYIVMLFNIEKCLINETNDILKITFKELFHCCQHKFKPLEPNTVPVNVNLKTSNDGFLFIEINSNNKQTIKLKEKEELSVIINNEYTLGKNIII